MNEKKLKKEIVEIFKKYKSVEDIGTRLIMLGFQKGKDEQKREELEFLLIMKEHIETNNCPLPTLRLNDILEQLQKEIGDNSQQPRMKQTRGGELKSDEGLHSTDNGSPADTLLQIEQRIRKGCGYKKDIGFKECGVKYSNEFRQFGVYYCPICQAQLNLIGEIRLTREGFEKWIETLNKEVNRKLWFELNSTKCANIVLNTWKQLQKEIREEKGK